MVERLRLDKPVKAALPRRIRLTEEDKARLPVGLYFTRPSVNLDFISSGCALLDCALGGGFPLGRIVNIVGDRSTGKTLLAIEAATNFYRRFEGHVWYCESEAAFDNAYAQALGLDIGRVLRPDRHINTVEDFFGHLESAVTRRGKIPGLYILDSLDALSDNSEVGRKFDDSPGFGAQKAKKLSELFRRIVRILEESRTCVMIISQIRDNIGVTFGRRYARSGGKALDFYASQIVYLAQKERIERTSQKVKRIVGIAVRAKVEKNKVGLPFREAEFPIMFGFGIDDVQANVDWLVENSRLDAVESLKGRNVKVFMSQLEELSLYKYKQFRHETQEAVRKVWTEVENRFMPRRMKYDNGRDDYERHR